MGGLLLQIVIVVAFGAVCFGCGYLTAFIITRNHWRDEMISAVSPVTTGRPANGNGESRKRNRRRGKCNDPKRAGLPHQHRQLGDIRSHLSPADVRFTPKSGHPYLVDSSRI
jgi:hypothetical protein